MAYGNFSCRTFLQRTLWLVCLTATFGCSPENNDRTEHENVDAKMQLTTASWAIDGVQSTCPTQVDDVALYVPGKGVQDKPVTIVLPPNAPIALQSAVQEDLVRDLEGLLGIRPVIQNSPSSLYNSIIITMAGSDGDAGSYHDSNLTALEAHRITTRAVGPRKHVVLDGADLRGAIYAIYTFSEKVLGVPPLWYWMSWQPTPLPQGRHYLPIPLTACRTVSAPETKYRAFFFNNQDFIKVWRRLPASDELDPIKMSRVFETLLRLKVNLYYDGILDSSVMANQRGLLSMRDMASLSQWNSYFDGTNPMPSPDANELTSLSLDTWCPVDAYTTLPPNSKAFVKYWRKLISDVVNKNADVLWLLGVRGRKDDGGLWDDVENEPTTVQGKSALQEAFAACQRRLLVDAYDVAYPKAMFYLWNELDDLYSAGDLAPANMGIIFGNHLRTHVPTASLTDVGPRGALAGYYQNLNMAGTGSYLVDGGGPWKAAAGFKVARQMAGEPLRFAMVNVGNFKPFLLSSAVTADLWWGIEGYPGIDSGVERALARHLTSLGPTQIKQLRELYGQFVSNFWRQAPDVQVPGVSEFPSRQYIWEDLMMRYSARASAQAIQARAGVDYVGDSYIFGPICPNCSSSTFTSANTVDEAIWKGLSLSSDIKGAIWKWRDMVNKPGGIAAWSNSLDGAEKRLFTDVFDVPAQVAIEAARVNYYAVRAANVYETDKDSAKSFLCSAKGALQNLDHALTLAEHGVFDGYYDKFLSHENRWYPLGGIVENKYELGLKDEFNCACWTLNTGVSTSDCDGIESLPQQCSIPNEACAY
jgi:Glycosyl hydrolase family 115